MSKALDHYRYSDASFEQLYASSQFPVELFTHEAHLRLAWIHLEKYGLELAEVNIDQQIHTYVKSLGATEKYNRTLTIAAIKTVHHFKQKSTEKDFSSFIDQYPQLKNEFKRLINAHYTDELIFSNEAKLSFKEPDILCYPD